MTLSASRRAEVRAVMEAVLLVAEEPVPAADLALLLELSREDIDKELENLRLEYEEGERGMVLREVAGGWRLATNPKAAPYLERFVAEHRSARLSQAALETLAILAYRQPISRAQVAEIRGVASDGVLRTLLVRGLIEEKGRDDGPGQAILYGTTGMFLERLGLSSLEQLPPLAEFMPGNEDVERMEAGLGPEV